MLRTFALLIVCACLVLNPGLVSGTLSKDRDERKDKVLYFVSFSMPEDSLKKAVEQAEKAGAILVLRGLKGESLVNTAQAIKDLMGERRVLFQIDPPLFKEYKVTQVPCICFKDYKVCGDVTLDYALETIASKEPSAQELLKRLRKGFYDR